MPEPRREHCAETGEDAKLTHAHHHTSPGRAMKALVHTVTLAALSAACQSAEQEPVRQESAGEVAPSAAPTTTAAAPAAGASQCVAPQAKGGTRVLIFSKTAGFRHQSIPTGAKAIADLGTKHNFQTDHTEDAAAFTDDNLKRYAAVVFLSTTGDVLNDAQQAAFERYIKAGGGFAGVHAATDTEYDWPWYGKLVGAYFKSHPRNQTATVNVVDRSHPSTKCLEPTWSRLDEWYDFRAEPTGVKVLATLDEKSYQGATMGGSHPIVWYHNYDGGRAWYTEMGHTHESFADPAYLGHLAGGIVWAATK